MLLGAFFSGQVFKEPFLSFAGFVFAQMMMMMMMALILAKQQSNEIRKYFQTYFHYEKRTTNNSFKSDIATTSKSQKHLYLQLNQLKKSAIQGEI